MSRRAPRSLILVGLVCATLCTSACVRSGPEQPMLQNSTLAAEQRNEARAVIDSDPARAEELLLNAIASDPFDARAYNNLGVLLFRRGENSEALKRFQTASRLDPGRQTYRDNIRMCRRAMTAPGTPSSPN